MPVPGAASDILHAWVVNLTKLKSLCINKVDKGWEKVGGLNLNPFALLKVLATVGDGNNFLTEVAQQFEGFDPHNHTFTLGDNTDFAEVTDWVSPHNMPDAVDFFIRSSAGHPNDPILPNAAVSTLYSDADWGSFMAGIQASNLDAVLGDSATIIKNLTAYHDQGSGKTYWDLLTFLSTIKAAKGGN